MARNQYTHTPGYTGTGRQFSPKPAPAPAANRQGYAGYQGMAQPRGPGYGQAAEKAHRPMGETLVLSLLFIVLPLCGVLSLFVHAMLWLFVLVAIASLTGMLALRCFAPRARKVLSGTLVVIMTAAVIALIYPSSQGNQGGYANHNNMPGQYDQTYQQQPVGPTAPIGGGSGGGEPQMHAGAAPPPEPTQTQSSILASDGEMVMNSYLQMWRDENYEGMVQYTLPSWRAALDSPQRQLSWNHSGWKLNNWRVQPEPSSPTADMMTLNVETTLMKDGQTTTLYSCNYKALLFRDPPDGDKWYVDPKSMQGSPTIINPDATMAPSATDEHGEPVPANPTTKPTVKLWYNPDRGQFYHLEQKCKTINEKYFASMQSFEYSELSRHAKLQPCSTCGAPR